MTRLVRMSTNAQSVVPRPYVPVQCSQKDIVYQVNCNLCGATYIGETSRPLVTRFQEHYRSAANPTAKSYMNIDIQLLPSLNSNGRETRSSDPNHQTFTTKQCKTTTYQKSFLNRSTRVWNVLPKALKATTLA